MLFDEYKMTHNELIVRGKRWLLGTHGCDFVLSEMMAVGNAEIPDLIGWNYSHSILVECKTSRADFHADKKKPFRSGQRVGVGEKKYFLCEKGIIQKEDLPEHWGLLWICGKVVRIIHRPPLHDVEGREGRKLRLSHERDMLVSALNRFQIRLGGDFKMINDINWNPMALWEMKYKMLNSYLGPI